MTKKSLFSINALILLSVALAREYLPSSEPTEGVSKERVFYFPFFSQTGAPITPSSIEGAYDLTSLLKHDSGRLVSLIEDHLTPSEKFDDSSVRLKIRVGCEKTIMCDLRGNVDIDGKHFKIDVSTRRRIVLMIREACPDDVTRRLENMRQPINLDNGDF